MKVLVIDDESQWLNEARSILVRLGAETMIHLGAMGAQYAAYRFRPDVVLLDLNMPKLDGRWLISELKKTGARIYFCSASEPGRLKVLARTVGASGVITKEEMRAPGSPALRRIIGKDFT